MIFGLPSSWLWKWSSPVVRKIADSLSSEPGKWRAVRGYWLDCDDPKVSIWIPNGAAFLYLNIGAMPSLEQISPSWPERELIWRAVRRLKVPSPASFQKQRALEILEGAQHT